MNFAKAVKGKQTRASSMRDIQSQAETELSRQLSKEELDALFKNGSPNDILEQIQKVSV